MKIGRRKLLVLSSSLFLASTTIGCSVNNANNAGNKIIIDADENIEMLAGGKVSIDSAEIEAVNQNTTRINAKRTFVSGKSIDIGGSTGVVLKTSKGTIKVNKFISADQSWASKVVQGLVCAASLPKYMK